MVGRDDIAAIDLLPRIGGWRIGSFAEIECQAAVDRAKANGWIGTRLHYSKMDPEGAPSWEVTDEGMTAIAKRLGTEVMFAAKRMRDRYRREAGAPVQGTGDRSSGP